MTPQGLAALDAMIARVETACERGKAVLDLHPAHERRYLLNRRARLQTMEDTLARLRAQREALAVEPGRREKRAPRGAP